jgi:hypothetical protein
MTWIVIKMKSPELLEQAKSGIIHLYHKTQSVIDQAKSALHGINLIEN